MEKQILTFREIIAPVTPEVFFAEYYRKKPIYIPGSPEKFEKIMTWDGLNALLEMSTLWSERNLALAYLGQPVSVLEYSIPTSDRYNRQYAPDMDRVVAKLQQGATLKLDYVETFTPALRSVVRTLESVLGAPVCCSLFCSWLKTQGYGAHFDPQNVFAMHVAGSKIWHVYEHRVVASNTPGHDGKNISPMAHEKSKGPILMEITMTPGDLLYLPHGQYHDAIATSEACLHASFGPTHFSGQDLVLNLVRELHNEPLFLQSLPHIDDTDGLATFLRSIAKRLGEIITHPNTASHMRSIQRSKVFERLADFQLPARELVKRYRVLWLHKELVSAGTGSRLKSSGNTLALDQVEARAVEWVMKRDYFSQDALEKYLEGESPETIDRVVAKLLKISLIERI